MRFFKNGCNGGNVKVLPEIGGSHEWGVGFLLGGWENFKVSLAFLS